MKHVIPGATVLYTQPLFSARPVWAVGEGWLALGHGDSSQVVVRSLHSADTLAVIRWPARRDGVTEDDRIEAAKWVVASRILRFSAPREEFAKQSPLQLRRGIEWEASEVIEFAELAPTVTALYGAGNCLFLAGYSPRDWGDGTALTWVAVNVREGSLQGVFRLVPPAPAKPMELDRRGAAVRAFDTRYAYTIHLDGDGVGHVNRYRLPTSIDCS